MANVIINYVYFGLPGAHAFFALTEEETPRVVSIQIRRKSEVIISTFSEKIYFEVSMETVKISDVLENFKGMTIKPINIAPGIYPQEKFLEVFGGLTSELLEMKKVNHETASATYGIAVKSNFGDYRFIDKYGELIGNSHIVTGTRIISAKSFDSKYPEIREEEDPRKLKASIEALSKENDIPMECISIVRILRKDNSVYETIFDF